MAQLSLSEFAVVAIHAFFIQLCDIDEHLHVLLSAVGKYIQLSKVLFQHRHLPLNWVTLCRLVALCPLLSYIIANSGGEILGSIRGSAVFCAEILEAFNESWVLARKAASVFRLFDGLPENSSPLSTRNGGIFSLSGDRTQLNTILEETRKMIEETMGRSSIYYGILDATLYTLSESRNETMLANSSNIPTPGFWMDDPTQWEDVGNLS
ncbi:uncharacterized protein LY89DRAFT_735896 [Mollisia scopiformis]|uniref:Uncharacterized protein n=1 Tax=Mollisia scopiformis TaxID=149040 RepID=A0A194X3T3_MOLSC|nr:uncharacterized protein LY89DRAFT_735896 [Mollisia scopiformis]KUJ14831.1 hypothetical protein LY89DRAFT_735896 [Mollisia scopiformis]